MNPYQILGVNENASEEEIKSAYRKLVKKYHPDRFANDPAQQAAAAEKLKSVNAAYDMIGKMKQGNYQWSNTPQFAQVRSYIQSGMIAQAEDALNRMSERPAEWHYLMGICMMRRGWYDGAAAHFDQAHQMEPNNAEYENAWRSMHEPAGSYMDFGEGGVKMDMSSNSCRICSILGCALCTGCCCCSRGGWIFCC